MIDECAKKYLTSFMFRRFRGGERRGGWGGRGARRSDEDVRFDPPWTKAGVAKTQAGRKRMILMSTTNALLRKTSVQDPAATHSHEVKKATVNPTPETLLNPDVEFPCLVRAVCGTAGKTKISTLVLPADTDRFQDEYGNIVLAHMDSLKKKVKKPKKVVKGKPAEA
ncbi:hypothetical protein BDK51DRAFT_39090 [Blyttiomyces helicus]|uniref:Signal recognition particle subunit SRP14 n=1 Tax=Blyttiomyces helicus TaxID=388810 RepID=A0A4P9W6C2_9FUNG|nr:hypothetical protein BDK51DRAFT_39090 [Blyttiomyces helicus]|eukprot:RKO88001.1 hypothetical protein BDK51DRAFT_39090 [Blyttiomyces helicus]